MENESVQQHQAPSTPALPADYAELLQTKAEYERLAATIEPYVDDIKSFMEDPELRDFSREARQSFVQQREARKPKIDPQYQPIIDRIENTKSEFAPVVEYVANERKAKEQAKADAEAAAQNANVEYGKRLLAEHPHLAVDDGRGIGMVAAYAFNRGISLEEAWKRAGGDFVAPVPKASPPRSLRGDAAAPGVPGESTALPIKSARDLTARLAANLRAGGMKG